MLYFFALNKSKTIPFYYSSPIIEIGIKGNKLVIKEGVRKIKFHIRNVKLSLSKHLLFKHTDVSTNSE